MNTGLLPAEEIVRRYEAASLGEHPYFRRLAREPVDMPRLWRLIANGREAIVRNFSRRLANVIARTEDERLRSMLAKQLNDELGNGDFAKAHRPLFDRFLAGLDPWRPREIAPDTLAPARELSLRLEAIYYDPDPNLGIGASMVIEVGGKQVDQRVGQEMRRHNQLTPQALEWLTTHEVLEIDHAGEAMEMARLIPTSGPALEAVWRGAEAVAIALWDFFDALLGEKTEIAPTPILFTILSGGAYPRATAKLGDEPKVTLPEGRAPGSMTRADFTEMRSRFPGMDERVYFASHCMGPLAAEFYQDLEDYRRSLALRKRAIPEWIDRVDEVLALSEALLNAPPGTVGMRDSATSGMASIATAIQPRPGKDRIVITNLDFHSARYLWKAQARRGFVVTEIEAQDGMEVTTEQLLGAIDSRTAIVAVSHVSSKTGALIDIQPVVRAAHAHGALVLLDVYQSIGAVPIDVQASGVDVIVGGTHKWLSGGSSGFAMLYVHPALAERLDPAFPGWFGHSSLASSFGEDFVPSPGGRRFQQGTPAIEPIYTARTGMRMALEYGVENLRSRHLELTDRLFQRAEQRGLPVRTPRRHAARGSFLCFEVPEPERTVVTLEARGIDIDWRPGAGLRVAPYFIHREDECDRVVDAIAEVVAAAPSK